AHVAERAHAGAPARAPLGAKPALGRGRAALWRRHRGRRAPDPRPDRLGGGLLSKAFRRGAGDSRFAGMTEAGARRAATPNARHPRPRRGSVAGGARGLLEIRAFAGMTGALRE